jgi:hypothetical protein
VRFGWLVWRASGATVGVASNNASAPAAANDGERDVESMDILRLKMDFTAGVMENPTPRTRAATRCLANVRSTPGR